MLGLAAAKDADSIEVVDAERAYPAFGVGVRVRRCTGVRIILVPSFRNASSKAWLNFPSRSWMRN
jgi:hypothetical protein